MPITDTEPVPSTSLHIGTLCDNFLSYLIFVIAISFHCNFNQSTKRSINQSYKISEFVIISRLVLQCTGLSFTQKPLYLVLTHHNIPISISARTSYPSPASLRFYTVFLSCSLSSPLRCMSFFSVTLLAEFFINVSFKSMV